MRPDSLRVHTAGAERGLRGGASGLPVLGVELNHDLSGGPGMRIFGTFPSESDAEPGLRTTASARWRGGRVSGSTRVQSPAGAAPRGPGHAGAEEGKLQSV